MNNRNKKIIFSIIIVTIAILGIIGVNILNKNITSKSNFQDENKVKYENKDSNTEDKKEDTSSKDVKEKISKENSKDNAKKDNSTGNQSKEYNTKAKNEQTINNSNRDKSKITTNNNENKNETTKVEQNNQKSNTEKNEVKKQIIDLYIVDGVNNKTLFCGQIPLNEDENFNSTMNKFLSNNGIKHINRGGYISMMYGLAEFSKGPNSGWCYYINGNKASVGISGYIPKNGDRVVWKYLKDGVNN